MNRIDIKIDPLTFETESNIDLGIKTRSLKRNPDIIRRKAWSEKKLSEILGNDFKDGESYHIISGGDIDALSYLACMINQQDLDYCLLSTWCMALDDVLQIEEWIKEGKIQRIDAYVGEIFPNSYGDEWKRLISATRPTGGRVCVFRNHAKIFAGIGKQFAFAIESSANINTNPRTENTVISIGEDIYRFYKDFFDDIVSFNRDFDDWKAWLTK